MGMLGRDFEAKQRKKPRCCYLLFPNLPKHLRFLRNEMWKGEIGRRYIGLMWRRQLSYSDVQHSSRHGLNIGNHNSVLPKDAAAFWFHWCFHTNTHTLVVKVHPPPPPPPMSLYSSGMSIKEQRDGEGGGERGRERIKGRQNSECFLHWYIFPVSSTQGLSQL